MIGLAGDVKNRGSLVANFGKKSPVDAGLPRNPDSGLVSAAQLILEAVQSGRPEDLSDALKTFVKMCNRHQEMEEHQAMSEMEGKNSF